MAFFMQNAGRTLSRQELFDSVWASPASLPGRTVDVHVCRLRRALTRHGGRGPIRTVRGAGYALGNNTSSVRVVPSPLNRHETSSTSATAGVVAVLERTHARFDLASETCPSGIRLDPIGKQARRFGRDLKLSSKQFQLLELLMSHRGKLLTREQIANAIDGNSTIGRRTVNKTVERLRKIINRGALPDPIRSVLGAGYKFNPDPQMRSRRSSANRKGDCDRTRRPPRARDIVSKKTDRGSPPRMRSGPPAIHAMTAGSRSSEPCPTTRHPRRRLPALFGRPCTADPSVKASSLIFKLPELVGIIPSSCSSRPL